MTPDEVGVYRGYRVAVEQDDEGWRAKATTAAGKTKSPLVCWSNRREIALDLIRAAIDRSVSDRYWPELPVELRRLP